MRPPGAGPLAAPVPPLVPEAWGAALPYPLRERAGRPVRSRHVAARLAGDATRPAPRPGGDAGRRSGRDTAPADRPWADGTDPRRLGRRGRTRRRLADGLRGRRRAAAHEPTPGPLPVRPSGLGGTLMPLPRRKPANLVEVSRHVPAHGRRGCHASAMLGWLPIGEEACRCRAGYTLGVIWSGAADPPRPRSGWDAGDPGGHRPARPRTISRQSGWIDRPCRSAPAPSSGPSTRRPPGAPISCSRRARWCAEERIVGTETTRRSRPPRLTWCSQITPAAGSGAISAARVGPPAATAPVSRISSGYTRPPASRCSAGRRYAVPSSFRRASSAARAASWPFLVKRRTAARRSAIAPVRSPLSRRARPR